MINTTHYLFENTATHTDLIYRLLPSHSEPSVIWLQACSDSPSPCMWTAPLTSWPLASVTPGKSRGGPAGKPLGSWCRCFPGPGWWSQVQSGSLKSPVAPCGSSAPSRSPGSELFQCCLSRLKWMHLEKRIVVVCADGGQSRGRCTLLGGWPRTAIQSHILRRVRKGEFKL